MQCAQRRKARSIAARGCIGNSSGSFSQVRLWPAAAVFRDRMRPFGLRQMPRHSIAEIAQKIVNLR